MTNLNTKSVQSMFRRGFLFHRKFLSYDLFKSFENFKYISVPLLSLTFIKNFIPVVFLLRSLRFGVACD